MIRQTIESISLLTGTVSGSGAVALLAMQQIDENTLVPIGILLTGVAVSAALAWKAATKNADYRNKLEELDKRIKDLEKKKCCGKGKK